jgi:C4-dicarboxylate transporter DctQ subunit
MLKKLNKNFEEVLCTFFLTVVFISVITQVILRFGFSSAAVWAEETAVYGLIFATYLGASLGIKRREHVRITFIVLSFPKKIKSSLYCFGRHTLVRFFGSYDCTNTCLYKTFI